MRHEHYFTEWIGWNEDFWRMLFRGPTLACKCGVRVHDA